MHLSHPSRRGLIALTLLVLAGALATALLLGRSVEPASADNNPNNYDCRGHVEKGAESADDLGATEVKYVFACSGPITGYQIQPDHAVQSIETEVFATDRATKEVVATDAFSCNGEIPGFGVNCIGTYQGNYENVAGQFAIDEKLCDEPRVDPLLTVMYASKDAKGNVVQAISGPYDLGRPRGCPKSARGGKTRIPQSKDTSAER
ncbi:MAG: hypothetical protein ABI950_10860 [Solirubrobacteraceae bacterium]